MRPVLNPTLRLALLVFTLLAAGCGGGGTSPSTPSASPLAGRSVERLPTAWSEAGRPLTLELVLYKPATPPPWPTLIFHHGSTGNGDDPATFSQTFESPAVAREFNERGWLVLFPQRRGRGQSDGQYDEGFTPDRSRYSCLSGPALAGLEHALEDAAAIDGALATRTDIDRTRVVIAGHSRGAAIALVHAAKPGVLPYRAVLNFAGGWLGEACADALVVNTAAARRAAAVTLPSLWIYAENDPFYRLESTTAMFDFFVASGGRGEFRHYRRSDPLASGHLIHQESALWTADVQRFLAAAQP